MRVLYVASRYHTNQIPVVKGWQKNGHEVMFVCQFKAGSEDYSLLKPVVLGYSPLFRPVLFLYNSFAGKMLKKAAVPAYFQAQFGLPPLSGVKRILKEFHPDIVILRDRSVYNAVFNNYCRKYNIFSILYNQTPLWEKPEGKVDMFHRVIRNACPGIRMTPVSGRKEEGMIKKENSYFVPFVVEPHTAPAYKSHFINDKINILCIGKFEKRKHHLELLEVITRLRNRGNLTITLIGECTREAHRVYLSTVQEFVLKENLSDQVKILQNLTLQQVYEEYGKADLFVLPSTGEFASISQLEAMSCSLPVICSDTNGTSDCVKQGINGYLFRDKDFSDLKDKLEKITSDRAALYTMGEKSYNMIEQEYGFVQYESQIRKMMSKKRAEDAEAKANR